MAQEQTLSHNPYAEQPQQSSLFLKVAPLSIVIILGALGTSLINVILPEVSAEFHADMATVQWATLAFLLFSTALIVPVGWLGDFMGRSQVLITGLIVYIAASLLGFFATELWIVVAARAIQGVGVAAMLSMPMALVRETVNPDQVGRAMGIIGSSMATGMALGPALGGVLAASPLGWRAAFLVFVPLGLLALVMVWMKISRTKVAQKPGTKIDIAGLLVLVAILSVYAMALTLTPGGWLGTSILLVIVAAGIVAFVAIENRSDSPLINFKALREIKIFSGLAVNFGGSFIMMTFTVIPPFFLTLGLGLESGIMGLVMAVGPVVAILSGVPAGRLVDRLGADRMTAVGLAIMTVATILLITLPPVFGVVGFLAGAVVLTPGNQIFMAANNTAIMSRAAKDSQGAISGMLNLARNLGFITATAVMALLFNIATEQVPEAAGATAGLQITFTLAAVVGLASAIGAWRASSKLDMTKPRLSY